MGSAPRASDLDTSEVVLNNGLMVTVTLSTLLRSPNEVIDRLDAGDVVLTRREGESLRLSKDSSRAGEHTVIAALSQMIAAIVTSEDSAPQIAQILQRGPFPWLEFLTPEARAQFVAEFLRMAHACASIERFDQLAVLVGNWRETAIAYSLGLDHALDFTDYLPAPQVAPDPHSIA